jgi:hypothetical protein
MSVFALQQETHGNLLLANLGECLSDFSFVTCVPVTCDLLLKKEGHTGKGATIILVQH